MAMLWYDMAMILSIKIVWLWGYCFFVIFWALWPCDPCTYHDSSVIAGVIAGSQGLWGCHTPWSWFHSIAGLFDRPGECGAFVGVATWLQWRKTWDIMVDVNNLSQGWW
jgi:hypothetical protein